MYQLQHIVVRLYTDYLIYKGFDMTRKYKKALKDNLDQLYIQALGQVVLEGFPQYYYSYSIVFLILGCLMVNALVEN